MKHLMGQPIADEDWNRATANQWVKRALLVGVFLGALLASLFYAIIGLIE